MTRKQGRAAVLVSLLAAVAAVAVAGCGSSPSPSSPTSVAVAPTAPPTGVSWVTYQGVQIPCADQGPKESCWESAPGGFQHNGPGAALAAISDTIRVSVAPDTDYQKVVGKRVYPSAARDDWLVARTQTQFRSPVAAGKAPELVGYTVAEYTPQRAVINVITRAHDGSLSQVRTTEIWTAAGDWVRDFPAESSSAPVVTALAGPPANLIALAAPKPN